MEDLKIKFGDNENSAVVSLSSDNEVEVFSNWNKKKMVIGVGKKEDMTKRKFILLARQVISLAKAKKIKNISFDLGEFKFDHLGLSDHDTAKILAVNFKMANFEFVKFKTKPKDGWNFVENVFVFGDISKDVKKGFSDGLIIGEEINSSRTL